MRQGLLHLANLVSALTPQTRFFAIRRRLFSASGVRIGYSSRLLGTVRIYFPNVVIGEECWIGAGTHISCTSRAGVSIGDRCDIAPQVLFITGSHAPGDARRRAGSGVSHPISIGAGTWIGARATFLGGSEVGSGCVVAAGSLVRDVFPDNVMIAGVPARIVRELHQ